MLVSEGISNCLLFPPKLTGHVGVAFECHGYLSGLCRPHCLSVGASGLVPKTLGPLVINL